jgi:hypothetical protein
MVTRRTRERKDPKAEKERLQVNERNDENNQEGEDKSLQGVYKKRTRRMVRTTERGETKVGR